MLATHETDQKNVCFRVSNISENASENDLQELFKAFGHIARIFLAKDKVSGLCKVSYLFIHSFIHSFIHLCTYIYIIYTPRGF